VRVVGAASILAIAACGRVGFEARVLADGGNGDAPRPPCDPTTPFGPASLVAGINDANYSANAHFSTDELEVFFQRTPGAFDTLFTATRATPSDAFGTPTPLAINDAASDTYDGVLSTDGVTLVFASTRTGGAGGIDIYRSTRPFTTATPITSVDTNTNEDQPYVQGANDALWYNSVAAGGEDIWVAPRVGADYGAGTMVTELSTASADIYPTPSPDGLVIYFGSDRPGGTGSVDIYWARRASTSVAFDPPVRVTELATADGESPSWISPDLCTLYFTSTRNGGLEHIYVARR
jgi:Tol biopolymer transport system component